MKISSLASIILLVASPCLAADTDWTGATSSDFLDASNWSSGTPSSSDDLAAINGGSNQPATIPAGAGTIEIGAIQIGQSGTENNSLVQNGGTLIIDGSSIGEEVQVGNLSSGQSSWLLTGDSVVLYDGPTAGDGIDTDGTGKNFDVGKSVVDGAGQLELTDNAVLRISDDLKIADGDLGNGVVKLSGSSQLTVGSGISASGITAIEISGDALLASGNSAGPGMVDAGSTDEGYLTLSTDSEAQATINVLDNGRLYARTLQQRNGESFINVQGNGQFHIFDVFEFDSPNLDVATVGGSTSGSQRTSHVSSSATATTTINLSGNASMSVDSELDDSLWSGLALSGGNNSGGNTEGGLTMIEISDQASFEIQQDLHMTLGTGEDAESILKVTGGEATVNINGNLRMAMDDSDFENPGVATLHAVITGREHSTINVGGDAIIGNGGLTVELQGYVPTGGETYTILNAGSIDGDEFRDVGFGRAELTDGLSWDLAIDGSSVILSILGGAANGDFNNDGIFDAADIDLLSAEVRAGTNSLSFDMNADGAVDSADRTVWVEETSSTFFGDANLDGEFNSGDFVLVFQGGKFEQDVDAGWSDGDWDGDGRFGSGDFVTAFQAGAFEQGPRAATSVPEPSSAILLCIALFGLHRMHRAE